MSSSSSLRLSFFWGSANNIIQQGVQFIIGVILARLLTPEEFGVLGILTVFLTFSDLFIESGFSQALIRKKEANNIDYSSVFFFNLSLSIIFYFAIFLLAGKIESYFEIEDLGLMIKVFMIKIIITSFSFIHFIILTKNLDFKIFTKISFISGILSGIIGIVLAYNGFGVWSLVFQSLLSTLFTVIAVNYYFFWLPKLIFNINAIKSLYKISSFLLFTSLISRFNNEVGSIVIGKYFSAESLGLYSRANSLKNLPSQTFNTILSKVSLPILSKYQEDDKNLRRIYVKLFLTSTFLSFFVMLFLISVSDNLIIVLLGEKWKGSILFFKYLSIIGMLYPLNALNNNLIIAKGKTKLIFKLSLLKFIIGLPVLVVGVLTNMEILVIGTVIVSIIHTLIYCYYSGNQISYSIFEQLKSMFIQNFYLFIICYFVLYIDVPIFNYFGNLVIQSITFLIFSIFFGELLKSNGYIELKNIFIEFCGIGLKKFRN